MGAVMLAAGVVAACASTGGTDSPRAAAVPRAAPAQVSPAAGTWLITVETPVGTREPRVTIVAGGESLGGTFTVPEGKFPLTNVSFQEGRLSFSVTTVADGRSMPLGFAGTIDGDALRGTFSSPFAESPATGRRVE